MPSLRDLGEFGFIGEVARLAGPPAGEVISGIGDDCAVLDVGAKEKLLVTTDAALEGRHFRLDWMTPLEVGRRTVAGAVSDIAAMGGRPFATFCTAAIPPAWDSERALELMGGVAQNARSHGAPLVGGDTVAAAEGAMLDVVVLGWAQRPWLRSGAAVGDALMVTGALGEARAALECLRSGVELRANPDLGVLMDRMTGPVPRVAEARVLAAIPGVQAAIDISDGLCQDAGHLAKASGVRIRIDAPRVPVSLHAHRAARRLSADAARWALSSGEEFELLLAVDGDCAEGLAAALEQAKLAPLTVIGEVVAGEGVVVLDEDAREMQLPGGWDHFKGEA